MRASSASSLGSLGAGAGTAADSFNSSILRASTSGSFRWSYRVACLANSVVAPISTSLASAAICSVSSVMKFDCTHDARLAFTDRSCSRASALFMNSSASATVGGFGCEEVCGSAAAVGVVCAFMMDARSTINKNAAVTRIALRMGKRPPIKAKKHCKCRGPAFCCSRLTHWFSSYSRTPGPKGGTRLAGDASPG